MTDEPAEYQQAITDLEETFRSGIRAFAKWFAAEYQLSAQQWRHEYSDPMPSEEWFKGHNAGVETILLAVDTFLDEYHP